jgi:RND family efflux transporter MFP subunit
MVAMNDRASAQGPPPAAVQVDAARTELVQEHRSVTGELRAARKARVAAQEPGIALEIVVEEGQPVTKGDVLARLDSKRLELDLREIEAQEQAALAAAEERRAESQWRQRDLETYLNLSKREASNPKELYDAEAQANIAKARLLAAERSIEATRARADLLRKRLDDMAIKAPFDGIVVAKHIEQGEWVEEGATIIDLVSTGAIDAWLDVPQKYADAIMGKQPQVTINVDATGAAIESSHVRAVPQVDSKARSFLVIVRIENPAGALASGMSVTGLIPTGEMREHLTLSKNALLRNDAGPYVYVARKTSPEGPASAVPTPVQILYAMNDRFVVQSPQIVAGDLVVVEGNERLFPMAPVTPIGASSEPGGSRPADSGGAAVNGSGGSR